MFFPHSSNLKALIQYSQPQNQSFPLVPNKLFVPGFSVYFLNLCQFLLLSNAILHLQSWVDVPLKINAADLAFNRDTATLFICHYYIFVSHTDESKFIYINRPTEIKGKAVFYDLSDYREISGNFGLWCNKAALYLLTTILS